MVLRRNRYESATDTEKLRGRRSGGTESDETYPIRIVRQVVDEGPLLALGLRSRRHSGGGGRTSSEHVSFRFVGVSEMIAIAKASKNR